MRPSRLVTIIGMLAVGTVTLSTVTEPVSAQRKIKLKKKRGEKKKKEKPADDKKTDLPDDITIDVVPKKRSKVLLRKKQRWLAVGLAMVRPGFGHFYLGKYSSGLVFYIGVHGLIGAGIVSMYGAISTKDVVVDDKIVREEDNTNQPLFIVGSIFLASGLILYVGSVIDAFLEISEYNRRIERLRRYGQDKKKASLKTSMYLARRGSRYYAGGTYRF